MVDVMEWWNVRIEGFTVFRYMIFYIFIIHF